MAGHPVSHWYYGHFHQSWNSEIDCILFSMLDIMEFKEIDAYNYNSQKPTAISCNCRRFGQKTIFKSLGDYKKRNSLGVWPSPRWSIQNYRENLVKNTG